MYLSLSPLDHYYLELDNGCIAVVTGNWHTQHCLLGYVKYCPSSSPTIWSRGSTFYERLIKTYSANSVREHTNWSAYVPHFDSHVPCIPVYKVIKVWDPIERADNLTRRARDELEMRALEVVLDIGKNTGAPVGITGSLLPGIHNPLISDMDFVIYGILESLDVVDYISSNRDTFKPLSGSSLRKWAENVSKATGLTIRDALKFYRNWRRGTYNRREYSITYNDGIYRDVLTMPSYRSYGTVNLVVELEGGPNGLNYPSHSKVLAWKTVETPSRIPFDIEGILSYEAVYMPALYEGGLFEVEGLLQCSDLIEACRVLLGALEYRGTIKYYT